MSTDPEKTPQQAHVERVQALAGDAGVRASELFNAAQRLSRRNPATVPNALASLRTRSADLRTKLEALEAELGANAPAEQPAG